MMKIEEILEQASGTIGAKRIFGEPYEKNGVTVIPAARVMGGAGGGEGQAPAQPGTDAESAAREMGTGTGGGFGLVGGPAGAFVIRGEEVKWVPAVDVNRLMLGFQLVMVVFFLVIRSIARSRAAARAE